jgi:putative SOS response-associated peptidase YedK
VNPLPNLAPSWNIAPTNDVAVVRRRPETGARHLDLLKWGLLPYWTKEPTRAQRPINARSETAAKPGMFRRALEQRRCLAGSPRRLHEGYPYDCAMSLALQCILTQLH